jgi:tol-pal system protein YbgF
MILAAVVMFTAVAKPVSAQDSETVFQLQALLEEMRELRGIVEDQQRELDNLRRRQRDQYLDLDQRLQQVGGADAPASRIAFSDSEADSASDSDSSQTPGTPVVVGPEVRPPIDAPAQITPLAMTESTAVRQLSTPTEAEQASYDRAFRDLRETRYADAAEGFDRFLADYPESSLAPNALYWLAESYYVTRNFDTALGLFQQLLDRFPGSNKEGDALLKIGFSHFERQEWSDSRAALEQVRAEYPNTTLSRLAEGRLRDMRLAGHQ